MDFPETILLVAIIISCIISLASAVISLIVLLKTKAPKDVHVDVGQIKEVIDLKIDQIEKANKYNASQIDEKIAGLQAEMKSLNEQSTKNYIDMMEKLRCELEKMSKQSAEQTEKSVESLNRKFDEFTKNMAEKFDAIDKNVAKSLSDLRRENGEKLDSIQKVVDEKLQKTIDERLKESFENVVTQIANVNNAIGEIKGIATDVGSLKNVLTNVKTKGIVGEAILGNIISEILTTDQYETNCVTKKGSRDPVEFAIKMPANGDEYIYLPIDSKFPLETYYKIKEAIDAGDKEALDSARKELKQKIKTYAKDISNKYIDAPNTTDFAIMFLPLEGLYIEVLESKIFEECQREFKINMAGPTTLSALLNALKQGFKSLAIEKKSADVFKLLEAVKTEFETFTEALSKTKKHVEQVDADLANLIGTRTSVMTRKLKTIGTINEQEAKEILEIEE